MTTIHGPADRPPEPPPPGRGHLLPPDRPGQSSSLDAPPTTPSTAPGPCRHVQHTVETLFGQAPAGEPRAARPVRLDRRRSRAWFCRPNDGEARRNSAKFFRSPKSPSPGIRSGRSQKGPVAAPATGPPFQPFFPQKPAPGSRLSHGPRPEKRRNPRNSSEDVDSPFRHPAGAFQRTRYSRLQRV